MFVERIIALSALNRSGDCRSISLNTEHKKDQDGDASNHDNGNLRPSEWRVNREALKPATSIFAE